MKLKQISVNRERTVGLLLTSDRTEAERIPGVFSRKLLREFLENYLDLIDSEDVEIRFLISDEKNSAILLMYPLKGAELAISVAGKTEEPE